MKQRSKFLAGGALAAAVAFSGGSAQATAILTFLINGDTASSPFSILNQSTAGEQVIAFGLDLAGTGFGFDTAATPAPSGSNNGHTQFQAVGGSDALTGLAGPVLVADGATAFTLAFAHFAAGEAFRWLIDVDPFAPYTSCCSVRGDQLIGAKAFVDFSTGFRALGTLQAVAGNPDASTFTVTSVIPTPGVPEPATWAMLIMGFGAAGAMLRSRRLASRAA